MRPPTSPYLIDHLFGLSFLTVRWYGVLIVSGAILAACLATRRAKARGIASEHVWNQLLLGMLLGILGARIYYVAFEWQRYAGRPLLEIINPQGGGLAIHGAIVGALIAVLIYTRRQHLPLLPWLDICVPTLLIGQAIGRWGNFFNQEAYGRPTTLPWGLDIPADRRIPPYDNLQQYPASTRFHPTFLYESLWCLLGVGVLLLIDRRFNVKPPGLFCLYVLWYCVGRFGMELLRIDEAHEFFGLRLNAWVSIGVFVLALLGFIWSQRRQGSDSRPAAPPPTAPTGPTMAVPKRRVR